MKPSIDKLYKYFRLEMQRNFDDGAVIGGLGKMFATWENEARLDGIPETTIQAVGERLRDYQSLQPKSRAVVLNGLWTRIQRESPKPVPSLEERGVPHISAPRKKKDGPAPPPAPQEESAPPTPEASSPPPAPAAPPVPRAPAPRAPVPPASPLAAPVALEAPLTVLEGVGPRYQKALGQLGLSTLRDALYYFPRRYDDYSRLKPINRLWYGETVTVIGTVQQITLRPLRGGKTQLIEAILTDGSGALRLTWFNQPWLVQQLEDAAIAVSGKIDQYLGRLLMSSPEWELLEKENLSTNRIVPVYPLTAKITQKWLRQTLSRVVAHWAPRVPDPLPEAIRARAGLLPLSTALQEAHFPASTTSLDAARHRLAFDEIFLLQLGGMRQRRAWDTRSARAIEIPPAWLEARFARLPFTLTGAQQKSLADIAADLASGRPMNRLLQGDVGSGKTVIAGLAIDMLVSHGGQAALMAPTSILAEQHYRSLTALLTAGENGLRAEEIVLLTGATPEAEKAEIRAGLADGRIKLAIGTHALIEDPVQFQALELVIIDEQHRFGVKQRAALREKGPNPHLLVMTATPIPRSLALTVYGDLDITVIDEMPPGRQEISTHILFPNERTRAYTFIEKQVSQGHQAFVIYPLVEESEKSEAKAAVEEHARLQAHIFPNLRLGLLHGRMKSEEKEEVMARFRDGEADILVSTSVVEVGVDVPNATVMVIEGANRFGLSQLHQFRGRVGRGEAKSHCLLLPDAEDQAENQRLQAMVETNNGFILAERDLEQRGPGDFLGTRQSGFSGLKMASITDTRLIEKARRHAQELFEEDPGLEKPEHKLLASALQAFWAAHESDIS